MSLNRHASHDPLRDLIAEHHLEIERYRRQQSQRLGCDIGYEWAAEEWMQKHFPDWKRVQWDRLVLQTIRANYLNLAGHYRNN